MMISMGLLFRIWKTQSLRVNKFLTRMEPSATPAFFSTMASCSQTTVITKL